MIRLFAFVQKCQQELKLVLIFGIMTAFTPATGNSLPDSLPLFSYEDLIHHSEMERKSLECLSSEGQCDLFLVALATNPDANEEEYTRYRQDFYTFLDDLSKDKRFGKKPKTQVRFVFKAIHDRYFRLYRENPHFSEIFSRGDYNCVTASVLFALAFDHYKIPYEIILLSHHVYLVAYPNQNDIVVETTHPMSGAKVLIDRREKAKAVQNLLDMKLVTPEEINQKGIDRIFSEVYLSELRPTLHQLMGALYNNKALEHAERFDYLSAYELFKKASVFNPTRLTDGMMMTYSSVILAGADFQNRESYRVLTEMDRFLKYNIPKQSIIDQGVMMMNSALSRGGTSLMDSAYTWMQNGFTDQFIKDEISFIYHYNMGLHLFKQFKRDESMAFLEKAYHYHPEDTDVQSLLIELLVIKAGSQRTSGEAYEMVNAFSGRFESINTHRRFDIYRQLVTLHWMNHNYVDRNFILAEKLRTEFEEKYPPSAVDTHEVSNLLEECYSRASLQYFRANRRREARAVLTSGINYLPESYDLKSKLEALR